MIDAPVRLLAGSGSRRLETLALERARVLLCRHRHPEAEETCADCRRAVAKEHPDLLVAAPERGRRCNTPLFEEASESKETTIPTALVRAVVGDASRLPYEATLRAVVLLDVDRTEAAAFSALLKILEEPPSRTRFLLTATKPRFLPPTILSRVVLERLPGQSRPETAAALISRGMRAEEAEARAAFVPNDVEEAAGLDLAAFRALRDALLEAASGTLLSESIPWAIALGTLLSGQDARDAADRLHLLAILLRDAVAASLDPAGQAVVHRERFRDLVRLGGVTPLRLLSAAGAALDLAAGLPESRRNARLAVEAFALSLPQREPALVSA